MVIILSFPIFPPILQCMNSSQRPGIFLYINFVKWKLSFIYSSQNEHLKNTHTQTHTHINLTLVTRKKKFPRILTFLVLEKESVCPLSTPLTQQPILPPVTKETPNRQVKSNHGPWPFAQGHPPGLTALYSCFSASLGCGPHCLALLRTADPLTLCPRLSVLAESWGEGGNCNPFYLWLLWLLLSLVILEKKNFSSALKNLLHFGKPNSLTTRMGKLKQENTSYNSTTKNPIKKWVKTLNKHFSKENTK